jgi:hypothetical protein
MWPLAKPQMETNMQQRTATFTRTPEAVGTKPRELLNPHQATREPTLLLLAAMEGSKRVVVHRLLAEAEVEVVGNRGRRVLVVRRAAVAAAGGAVEGDGADEVIGC